MNLNKNADRSVRIVSANQNSDRLLCRWSAAAGDGAVAATLSDP